MQNCMYIYIYFFLNKSQIITFYLSINGNTACLINHVCTSRRIRVSKRNTVLQLPPGIGTFAYISVSSLVMLSTFTTTVKNWDVNAYKGRKCYSRPERNVVVSALFLLFAQSNLQLICLSKTIFRKSPGTFQHYGACKFNFIIGEH